MAAFNRKTSPQSTDMDLAFKTREKLAGTNSTDGADLRRTVLLCNTYDTFQKRMTEHFSISRTAFTGMNSSDKPEISCREIAVTDDDDGYESDDTEDSDDEPDEPSDMLRRPPPIITEDEEPPPYEMYASIEAACLAPRAGELGTVVTTVEDAADDETADAPCRDAIRDLPAYSAPPEEILDMTKLDLHTPPQHIENVAEVKLDPPALPPRNSNRLRPGLASRMSYGHHTVQMSPEHAHGKMEVH